MQGSSIATRDPRDGRPLEIAGRSVQWSSGDRWDGLVAERISVERAEPPEFAVAEHCLVLPLTAAPVDFYEGGGFRAYLSAPGHVSVLAAGAARRMRYGPQQLFVIALSPALLRRAAGGDGRRGTELAEQRCIADPRAEHIARALLSEAEAGAPSGALYAESLGMALAAHLLRSYCAPRVPRAERRGGLAPHRLRQLTAFVEEHLGSELRLRALADVAGLSPCRFAHNFKQSTGLAPHQFVVRARLDRAQRLLRETDHAITRIACETGFGSASRFAVVFRRAKGTTPTAYRASFR